MAKIGIFGGSFNPPHLGHILAVKEFQNKLGLDQVLLIPSSVPPHKRLSANSPGAEHRLRMTELAFSELPYAKTLDLELRRSGLSYTADTVRVLRERYPEDELYLLMGTDMFLTFSHWYHPEEIAAEVTLVGAVRDASGELTTCAKQLEDRFQAKTILLENDFLPYSSTAVRAMLAFDCAQDYLAPQVLAYIRENHLYYSGGNLKRLPFPELFEISLSLHRPDRVKHAIGCSETAERLAIRYGANPTDAKRAGILHDVTKALGPEEQLRLCRRYGVELDAFERENPKLLHAKTGAVVAREVFGENDAVFSAIYWHTTGKADMGLLEKILYLADYMEPNRDFEGVEELRSLTQTELDAAMLLGIRMTIAQLLARGRRIDQNSLSALRFLEERMQKT